MLGNRECGAEARLFAIASDEDLRFDAPSQWLARCGMLARQRFEHRCGAAGAFLRQGRE